MNLTPANTNKTDRLANAITNAAPASNTYVDSFNAVNHDGDTTETMTLLGSQLTNPYLIPNMQQAYANLRIATVSVTVTHQYVKFKPTSDQVSYLDSFMDAQGLDMFDAPLDYQILLEGDYYQDPSIPDSLPTWQYAVVPTNFTFPSGIQYQVLAQIHIPGDSYTAVETEAERLASLGGSGTAAVNGTVHPDVPDCGPDSHWDFSTGKCVPNNCPTGYTWNGSACVPPQTSPPPQAPDAGIPAGGITVDETQQLSGLAVSPANSNYRRAPIRKATIVARRWFKVERTYTDDNGHFQLTKHFKNKVRINIKFKNDDAIIRSMRTLRVWQMLFPLKKTFGVFDANKTNIDFNFQKWDTRVTAKGNRFWSGATVHNAVQEYKGYATTLSTGQPPGKLRILLTNLTAYQEGATPMWNKRNLNDLPIDFVLYFFGSYVPILKHEVDVAISYKGPTSNYADFKSDDLKETAYHELTHTTQYNQLGNGWYSQFVTAEINGTIDNWNNNTYSPYGNGTKSYSPIIALGESWAYHMGPYMADMRYGNTQSSDNKDQGITYKNNIPINGLSSHLNLLESFSPYRTYDPFYWIPRGLYYDLFDASNINDPVLNDNVSGYTNQQMFNAFNSNIITLQGYKANLLSQNGNSQSTQVISLFSAYGY